MCPCKKKQVLICCILIWSKTNIILMLYGNLYQSLENYFITRHLFSLLKIIILKVFNVAYFNQQVQFWYK